MYEANGAKNGDRLGLPNVLRRLTTHFVNGLLADLDAYDEQQVEAEINLFWQDVTASEDQYEIGTLVHTVTGSSDMPPIQLGPGIELRLVRGQWARDRFERAETIPTGAVALSVRATWPRHHRPSFNSVDSSERDRLISRAMLGLYLVRPRWHYEHESYQIKLSGRQRVERSKEYGGLWPVSPPNPDLTLSPTETEELIRLGAVLSRMPASVILDPDKDSSTKGLALRTFTRSFGIGRGQDAIVDLAVVLEALFSDSPTELTHKIAMRTALLIGFPPGRATKIFKTVRAFYALRSAIVHASPSNIGKCAMGVITFWRGKAALPQRRDLLLPSAQQVGAEIVADALRACLHLEATGCNPFSESFPGHLDRLAFYPRARHRLLRDARVLRVPRSS